MNKQSGHSALKYILIGIAMNALTLNFQNLDFLLPLIGIFFCLIGFRTLRNENIWFKRGWYMTTLRAASFFPVLVLNATIHQESFYSSSYAHIPLLCSLVTVFSLIICFVNGLKTVRDKAELITRSSDTTALPAWYVILCFLAFLHYEGLLIFICVIIAYVIIIYRLNQSTKELAENNCTMNIAPIRIPDKIFAAIIALVLGSGIACGSLYFNRYSMNWKEISSEQNEEIKKNRAQLVKLGFPEDILKDLSSEDILSCKDATHIVSTQREYDNLQITGISVEFPDTPEHRKIFHHFLWKNNPGFHGTEALRLLPTFSQSEPRKQIGDFTGQILYTKDQITYVSPYHSLKEESYQNSNEFFGGNSDTNIFATFSMPRTGKKHRGYIAYEIINPPDDLTDTSQVEYIHQTRFWQFPALTAKSYYMTNLISSNDPFEIYWDTFLY